MAVGSGLVSFALGTDTAGSGNTSKQPVATFLMYTYMCVPVDSTCHYIKLYKVRSVTIHTKPMLQTLYVISFPVCGYVCNKNIYMHV